MMNDVTDFPENSRATILRAAILCVYSDGSWHELEREQLENVYRNICVTLDDDLDEDQLLLELEDISEEVTSQIESLGDKEETEAYWQECLESIVLEDLQQLAVGAALALSTGDSEIDTDEMSAITRLCDTWDVSLKDAEDIWND